MCFQWLRSHNAAVGVHAISPLPVYRLIHERLRMLKKQMVPFACRNPFATNISFVFRPVSASGHIVHQYRCYVHKELYTQGVTLQLQGSPKLNAPYKIQMIKLPIGSSAHTITIRKSAFDEAVENMHILKIEYKTAF